MKTLALLTSLPFLFLTMTPAPGSRHAGESTIAPVPQKVVTGLTNYFKKQTAPLKAAQIETMGAPALETWLRQTSLPAARKTSIRAYLQPVLKAGKFEAIFIKKATLLNSKHTSDMVLVRVPTAVKNLVDGASYVVIFADSGPLDYPEIEKCQYISCNCSSTDTPGLCVTATQFNKDCPPNECPAAGGACDCGGGGGANLEVVFQSAFG